MSQWWHLRHVVIADNWLLVRVIFVWPWKMVLVSVGYLFYQPMDEKIKTWPLCFPAKENPNMEKVLFDWPIVLQYDVKAKYRLISRKFSAVSVRLTNQIALFPFVCCFCFVRAFSFQGHTKIALSNNKRKEWNHDRCLATLNKSRLDKNSNSHHCEEQQTSLG